MNSMKPFDMVTLSEASGTPEERAETSGEV